MKKILVTCGLLFIFVGVFLIRKNDITSYLNKYLNSNKVISIEKNEYYRDYDFNFVQNTDNFYPKNYQDILNIYYTVINSGSNSFTFYCSSKYKDCIRDVKALANSQDTLSDINNYVHPYNGFSHIESEYNSLGKVTIQITHNYTSEDINKINNKVNELYLELYNNSLSIEDNIKIFHDYIINNSRYDSARSDSKIKNYKSDIAYGPLFEGYALCGGYTDLMQLFLEKMHVKNIRL